MSVAACTGLVSFPYLSLFLPITTPSSCQPLSELLATKKAKPDPKDAKAILKDAAADLLDVSSIIQCDPDEEPPIYDTCDSIRRKICALLARDGITQATFLRAIVATAHRESSTKKIQAASLYSFMKQKGPLAGNTSSVDHAAYVFFEKLRIKQGKPN